MTQYSSMFNLKLKVRHFFLYFMDQWLRLLCLPGIMTPLDPMSDLKLTVGHSNLYS